MLATVVENSRLGFEERRKELLRDHGRKSRLADHEVLRNIQRVSLSTGMSGGASMAIQVGAFMWLHTVFNHQCANGGTLRGTLGKLVQEGGVARLYRGLLPTMMLSCLVRFGDITANAFSLAAFAELEARTGTRTPLPLQTAVASMVAALWRVTLTPIEVLKTNLMVSGPRAWDNLRARYRSDGLRVAYYGSVAGFGLGWAAHYPWFFVFNHLQRIVPQVDNVLPRALRNGVIGFTASSAAACTSNWVRVVKTVKQTNRDVHTYREAISFVFRTDGIKGVLTRGLGTRILLQGLQGFVFTVVWKTIEDWHQSSNKRRSAHSSLQ